MNQQTHMEHKPTVLRWLVVYEKNIPCLLL